MKKWLKSGISASLALTLAAGLIPTLPAYAASARQVKVYYTISDKGDIAKDKDGKFMAQREVTASDLDGDGQISYDEANVAVHKKYCKDGKDGYAISGGWVTSFWGQQTDNTSFMQNGKATPTVDKAYLAEGDYLTASINKDTVNYADWNANFDSWKKDVKAGKKFTLHISGDQAMSMDPKNEPAAGVSVGTVTEKGFTKMAKADAKGNVKLSFKKAGIYLVSAQGSMKGTSWSGAQVDCPLIAPACLVTVRSGVPSNMKTLKAAAKTVKSMKKNESGSTVYGTLQAQSTSQAKTSVKLTWKKVDSASSYVVYGAAYGKSNKYKKITTTSKLSATVSKIGGKKLKKGSYYKFFVLAADKDGNVLSVSKAVFAATKGGKVTNTAKLAVKDGKKMTKALASLKAGKTVKISVSQKKAAKDLKLKNYRSVRFESSDSSIASVTGKGTVKGKKKGSCSIYIYAQNGAVKKLKVSVR